MKANTAAPKQCPFVGRKCHPGTCMAWHAVDKDNGDCVLLKDKRPIVEPPKIDEIPLASATVTGTLPTGTYEPKIDTSTGGI